MSLPHMVHILLGEASDAVRRDPKHNLAPSYREAVYQSFGPLIDLSGNRFRHLDQTGQLLLAREHHRYGSLALLTAQHVVAFWDQGIRYAVQRRADFPTTMPREILTLAEAVLNATRDPTDACSELFNYWYHALHDMRHITYNAWCAVEAAYVAAGMILGVQGDVTDTAVQAYCAIDTNDQALKPMHRDAVRFDAEKRLAFWEWWLNKAIPAVWQDF